MGRISDISHLTRGVRRDKRLTVTDQFLVSSTGGAPAFVVTAFMAALRPQLEHGPAAEFIHRVAATDAAEIAGQIFEQRAEQLGLVLPRLV